MMLSVKAGTASLISDKLKGLSFSLSPDNGIKNKKTIASFAALSFQMVQKKATYYIFTAEELKAGNVQHLF